VADLGGAHKQLIGMVDGYVNYYMKSVKPKGTQSPEKNEFGGFQIGDTKTWQQRQQHLSSIGIDTAGWGRAEIMQGRRNKWNN